MREEFIPYTEALALKELGFDEPCFSIYKTNGELIFTEFYEYNKLLKYSEKSHIGSDWLSLKCYAPLYQQAFRFFREKYGLYTDIYRNGVKFNACIEDLITGNSKETVTDNGVEYEEAELECLKKLIEIADKNKKI